MRKYSICPNCRKKCDENLFIEAQEQDYLISYCKKCNTNIFITISKSNKTIKKEKSQW